MAKYITTVLIHDPRLHFRIRYSGKCRFDMWRQTQEAQQIEFEEKFKRIENEGTQEFMSTGRVNLCNPPTFQYIHFNSEHSMLEDAYVNAPLMAATPSSSVEIHFLYLTVSISMLISCKKCLQNIQRNVCTCSWNLERADLFKKYIISTTKRLAKAPTWLTEYAFADKYLESY